MQGLQLTIGPGPCRNTYDFVLILFMINNGANTKTHDSKRWRFGRGSGLIIREGVYVLGIHNSCFNFTPGYLQGKNKILNAKHCNKINALLCDRFQVS